jgi:hypothetical protein
VARVDQRWFDHAVQDTVLDTPVLLCPVEETIWSKAFVMERERFDGADIAHLIRGSGRAMDWQRVIERFGAHWRVLLSHLVMFGFIYPGERDIVPAWVMNKLTDWLRKETTGEPAADRVCHGTLLSRAQYLVDIESWGYEDARTALDLIPREDIDHWTEAIANEKPTPATRPMFRCE